MAHLILESNYVDITGGFTISPLQGFVLEMQIYIDLSLTPDYIRTFGHSGNYNNRALIYVADDNIRITSVTGQSGVYNGTTTHLIDKAVNTIVFSRNNGSSWIGCTVNGNAMGGKSITTAISPNCFGNNGGGLNNYLELHKFTLDAGDPLTASLTADFEGSSKTAPIVVNDSSGNGRTLTGNGMTVASWGGLSGATTVNAGISEVIAYPLDAINSAVNPVVTVDTSVSEVITYPQDSMVGSVTPNVVINTGITESIQYPTDALNTAILIPVTVSSSMSESMEYPADNIIASLAIEVNASISEAVSYPVDSISAALPLKYSVKSKNIVSFGGSGSNVAFGRTNNTTRF